MYLLTYLLTGSLGHVNCLTGKLPLTHDSLNTGFTEKLEGPEYANIVHISEALKLQQTD